MRNWVLILVGIGVLTVIFLVARSLQDEPEPSNTVISPSGGATETGSASAAGRDLPMVGIDGQAPAASADADETLQQELQMRVVPELVPGSQSEPTAGSPGNTASARRDIGGPAAPAGSAGGPGGQAWVDPGIAPEAPSGTDPQPPTDVDGPGGGVYSNSSGDAPDSGRLTEPATGADVPEIPTSDSPAQAPEASDPGIVGPSPESSDPGVTGPAPEDS